MYKERYRHPKKYRKEFCQLLVEHMSKGHSIHSFPSAIHDKFGVSVDIDTINIWSKKYPEFKAARKLAESKAIDLFEKFLMMHITGVIPEELKKRQNSPMNKKLLAFAMKNRFRNQYGDQLKIENTSNDDYREVDHDIKKVSDSALRKAKTILVEDFKKIESEDE